MNSPMCCRKGLPRELAGLGGFLGLLGMLGLAVSLPGAEVTVALTQVRVTPLRLNPNLLSGAGFEAAPSGGPPPAWRWDRRNTESTCQVDDNVAHSGRKSLRLTSPTEPKPQVYGLLQLTSPIPLQAGKSYVLSAWVRSAESDAAWLGGGADWRLRVRVPATAGAWQRVARPLVASAQETNFNLVVVVDRPTLGVWLDDLKLEPGDTATAAWPIDGALPGPVVLGPLNAEQEIEGDGEFAIPFFVQTTQAFHGSVYASFADGTSEVTQRLELAPGHWQLEVMGHSSRDGQKLVSLQFREGDRRLAQAETLCRFYSAQFVKDDLEKLRQEVLELKGRLNQLRSSGSAIDYPQVTLTVLENFADFVQDDVNQRQVRRATRQLQELQTMAVQLRARLQEDLLGKPWPAVPRWNGRNRPQVWNSSFLAFTVTNRQSKPLVRPVFFTGYGHFGQVQADLEKFPAYGANLVQFEVGPSRLFPRAGETNLAPVREILTTLDRAAQAGVAVNLLISPHYFPDWALEQYPHLRVEREGFIHYCLHAPEAQALLRRYLEVLIPLIHKHPALHSLCLANEPINSEAPCSYARTEWIRWLQRRHGDVATLNRRWGANYAKFEDAPLANPLKPENRRPSPAWMDFVRFNQEWFSGWHETLATAIRKLAPDLPVHTKAMTWTFLYDADVRFGVDAFRFAQWSDILGNDSVNFYHHGAQPFAQSWELNAMSHDLQRSVKKAPVFNSENHLIPDRETREVPPEHVRSALWQAAIHGQSATTLWVWERTADPQSDFAGSILHRPACVEAVGLANLDLNRVAEEIAALQQAPAQVLILHGATPLVWDGEAFVDCLKQVYLALDFAGIKVGFLTEAQLEQGRLPESPVVVVPQIRHLSEAAMATLQRHAGELVLVGERDLLAYDEYHHRRTLKLQSTQVNYQAGQTDPRALREALRVRLRAWGIEPEVSLREVLPGTVRFPWGVELRSVRLGERVLVNLCNYNREPTRVQLTNTGLRTGVIRDVLSGEVTGGILELAPLETRLLRWDSAY